MVDLGGYAPPSPLYQSGATTIELQINVLRKRMYWQGPRRFELAPLPFGAEGSTIKLDPYKILAGKERFERPTLGFGDLCSTAELHPCIKLNVCDIFSLLSIYYHQKLL